MMKLIALYKRTFLLVALAMTVMAGSCGGESYWRDLEDGSSSNTLPPSFPVGIYVSTTGNDTTGDGSPGNPYQTIQNGITQAAANGLHAVFVEAGTYNISAEITILEGISLYGGFRQGNWNDRSITPLARDTGSPYRTEIISTAARAIRGTGVITSATVVEGFVISGATAFYNENNSNPRISNNTIIGTGNVNSYGVYNLNSSPGIQFNIIIGASVAADNAYGVYNIGGGSPTITINTIYGSFMVTVNSIATALYSDGAITTPIIAGNAIYGGPSASISRGVHNRNGAGPGIGYNRIEGGVAPQSWGVYDEDCGYILLANDIRSGDGSISSEAVYCFNATTKIINNTIRGGPSNGYSTGISLFNGSHAHIFNNTIDGGAGLITARAIYIWISNPLIINNILFISGATGTRTGIYEGDPGTSDPVELTHNNFFDCPVLYRNSAPPNDILNIGDVNDSAQTTQGLPASSTLNISVILSLDSDFRIISPPTTVRDGGADLTGFLNDDKDEHPRTVPWSIGAYEYD
ncbi:MAG: hypothetical protein AB2L13_18305 [Spirochaetota bacterium]